VLKEKEGHNQKNKQKIRENLRVCRRRSSQKEKRIKGEANRLEHSPSTAHFQEEAQERRRAQAGGI
jgi:hypothetical protein